jgi:hypothetical protein
MIFQIATGSVPSASTQTDTLFLGLALAGGAVAGYWHGPMIVSDKHTRSLLEACWRAELIMGEVILFTLVSRQLWIGVRELFGPDPVGGLIKILMLIPFGPITALLAFLYTVWATVPPAIACGALLYFGFNPEARRQRLSGHH